jgi:Universal stress protein UspA and related nucleotide-binding proteins
MSAAENLGQIEQIVSDTDPASQRLGPGLIRHILVPVNLSDESRNTVEYAVPLAELCRAKLTLLHVWTTPGSHTGVLGALDPEAIQRSRDRAEFNLRRLEEMARERYPNIESYFLTGEPCSQIVAFAESSSVDLILVSTHEYDRLRNLVEGSDAEKIMRQAPCPVWIVRAQECIAT